MNELIIKINGQRVNIGEPINDKIEYLNITYKVHPMFIQPLNPQEIPLIKQWLNQLMDNLDLADGYLTYNNTMIKQEDLVKFKL